MCVFGEEGLGSGGGPSPRSAENRPASLLHCPQAVPPGRTQAETVAIS